MTRIPNVLAIAGSDPGGGAGIQADLKTISAMGCYAMAALTALTAQNTVAVTAIHIPPAAFVAAQIDAVFADIRVDAVKIGMLADATIAATVAERLQAHDAARIVLDPVMVAKSGDHLLDAAAVATLRDRLLPMAAIVTPNLPEAGVLLGIDAPRDVHAMRRAVDGLMALGARAVLLKSGHLEGDTLVDLLHDGTSLIELTGARLATRNTHGTGCTLSSAIAAGLALHGDLERAVRAARAYVFAAIRAADGLEVGYGHGPLDHFHASRQGSRA